MSNLVTTKSQDMFEIMDKAWKFANIISKSDILPTHYRNKPENCFIAVQTAFRMNIDPMHVIQNTYIVNGNLGMKTSFAISLANQSRLFKGTFKYEINGQGNELEAIAKAIIRETGEEIAVSVNMKIAMAEGWTRNPKYKTMPEHMLKYRAATFLIRLHVPEVLNGLQTVEELEDIKAAETKNVTPEVYKDKTSNLVDKLSNLVEQQEVEPEIETFSNNRKENLLNELTNLLSSTRIDSGLNMMCEKLGIDSILEMTEEQLLKAIDWAKERQEV